MNYLSFFEVSLDGSGPFVLLDGHQGQGSAFVVTSRSSPNPAMTSTKLWGEIAQMVARSRISKSFRATPGSKPRHAAVCLQAKMVYLILTQGLTIKQMAKGPWFAQAMDYA